MLAEPLEITYRVIEAFDQIGIPYLLGGSLASALHGAMRSTLDADLVADLHPKQVQPLIELLQDAFYIDENMILDAIKYQSSFNLIHLATTFKVDVFIMKHSPFEQSQFQRRQNLIISDDPLRKAYVASPEDILLAKVVWYREGNEVSDRQWKDILGVCRVQAGKLDLDYLSRWAAVLGVSDLLARAVSQTKE